LRATTKSVDKPEGRGNILVIVVGICVGLLAARTMFGNGIIGYSDDWNVPASPRGLWVWGIADLSPWRPIEFGLPLAYPTELYLKLALGLFGLLGISPHLVVALFLTACVAAGFIGMTRLTRTLWAAPMWHQLCAGLLYVTSPTLFDALVPGYLTFILAYAALPWLAEALLQALRGKHWAWFGYAFFVAVSLAQVQFAIFDFALSVCILLAAGLSMRRYLVTACFFLVGCVLPYMFIVVNVLQTSIVGLATGWSQHSWTALSAPGIVRALMLVPSVYPYFDSTLGAWQHWWRLLGVVLVVGALTMGLRSRTAFARAFLGLLVLCLIFLHGPNPPIMRPMTWLLDSRPLAILRNINYVFALVALLLPVLLTAPRRMPEAADRSNAGTLPPFGAQLVFTVLRTGSPWKSFRVEIAHGLRAWPYNLCLGLLTIVWSLPWMTNTYAKVVSPIPGPNDTKPIIGPADRTLVFPHLQVVDSRRATRGGVNPNSVETITPIFVRNTPSGILEPSILDRLTDWESDPTTFGSALRTAHVNAVALQTSLDSTFPVFVNSYLDHWLFDAYKTASFSRRLGEADSVSPSVDGTTVTYRAQAPHQTDVQTTDSAVAVNGSAEHEIALRGIGLNSIFIPAPQIADTKANWIEGFVQQLGAPELVPSASDIKEGAFVPAGILTDHRSADFHADWTDLMDSDNWWLSTRLMQQPNAAITDGDGLTLSVPVPPGLRHVWLTCYVSVLGGTLKIDNAGLTREVDTRDAGDLGSFRWLDLGWMRGGRNLLITSVRGFNGVGDVLMLSPSEMRTDRRRAIDLGHRSYAELEPNATLDHRFPLEVAAGWHPAIVLGNVSNKPPFSAQAALLHRRDSCSVMLGNGHIADLSMRLDGKTPDDKGAFFPVDTVPCGAHSRVTLDGVELSESPITIKDAAWNLRVVVTSADGQRTTTSAPLTFLPLAFHALAPGRHLLRFSYPSLLVSNGWSPLENALTSKNVAPSEAKSRILKSGATQRLTFTVSGLTSVMRRIPLRPQMPADHFHIVGTYVAVPKSMLRITLIHPGANEFIYDLWGDGKPHYYHLNALYRVARHPGDQLYVYYFPPAEHPGAAKAQISISLVEGMAADLILMEPGFSVGKEKQISPDDLGMNRQRISGVQRVVQYDQTYDKGWRLSGRATHYSSTSGFNVWVRQDEGGSATISYQTGVSYTVAAILSLMVLCALGLLSFPLAWRSGSAFVSRDRRFR
jgi:hypothetical protein